LRVCDLITRRYCRFISSGATTIMITGLYLITDGNGDGRLARRVAAALAGGARVVQYRDKNAEPGERLKMARQLCSLCHKAGALFLANDDPRLALDCGADGVHLGQGDGSVSAARALLGGNKIIGVSTRTALEARRAEAEGADYIGLGAIFATGSKNDAKVVGLERLREVRAAVSLPIVAIGGIDYEHAGEVIDAGADALATISAVMGDPSPALAARELALLFNRRLPCPRGRVLTVAGSDSGGGAGIQADLKTIALLGSYGMSAVTALTAQNTLGVSGIHPAPADFVALQIETVLSDIGCDVLKTGMLFDAAIVAVVARAVEERSLLALVDPVMVAKGGAPLLRQEAIKAFCDELIPRTYLLTPNLPEAEALTGLRVTTEAEMERAALRLQAMGARNVLLKGGHLEGEAVDLLLDGETLHRLAAPRIATVNTHGTGCSYAAAIAAALAQGLPLPQAVALAKAYITEAIRSAVPLGSGHGPVNHWIGARAVRAKAVTGDG
jgi:hydroxymethylpyrimidine kinase/phosphomethylpyrimidine kinase/thiamine-phosphate diphosphorylase